MGTTEGFHTSAINFSQEINKVAVALVSCGMEMPKPNQIKAYLELTTADAYNDVREFEDALFEKMVKKVTARLQNRKEFSVDSE